MEARTIEYETHNVCGKPRHAARQTQTSSYLMCAELDITRGAEHTINDWGVAK